MKGCACQRRGMRPIWTDVDYEGTCRRCGEYPLFDAPAEMDTIVEFKPSYSWRNFNDVDKLLGTTLIYAGGGREGSGTVEVMGLEGRSIRVDARACFTIEEARQFRDILSVHIASAERLAARYGEDDNS